MTPSDDLQIYNPIAQTLHWLIGVLVLCLILAGLILHYDLLPKPESHVLRTVHIGVGLTVLVLMVLRLGLRLRTPPPALPAAIPPAERLAARAGHAAMYAMVIAMPVFGVIFMQAHGREVSWFGLLTLPALVGEDKPESHLFAAFHFWGGWILLVLIVVHLSALAWHRRQGIWLLPRMWPGSKPPLPLPGNLRRDRG